MLSESTRSDQKLELCFIGSFRDTMLSENLTVLRLVSIDLDRDILTKIGKCSGLQELWLCDLGLEEMPDVSGLKHLGKLLIYGNKISDIRFVRNLTKLNELQIQSNSLSGAFDLSALPSSVKSLDVSGNSIRSLINAANLQHLAISGNPLETITSLLQLRLQSLDISSDCYTAHKWLELSSLKSALILNIPTLERLDDLEVTPGLRRALECHLYEKKILLGSQACHIRHNDGPGDEIRTLQDKLEFLGTSSVLFSSYCDYQVRLEPTIVDAKTRNLAFLTLVHCGLSDCTPLLSLVALQELSIRSNNVTSLEAITQLPRLRTLDASDNRLLTLKDLEFRELLQLEVSHNQITCLNFSAPKLIHLHAEHNAVSEISQLYPLKRLPSLKILYLNGNQVSKDLHYESFVLFTCKSVQILDGIDVTKDMVIEAMRLWFGVKTYEEFAESYTFSKEVCLNSEQLVRVPCFLDTRLRQITKLSLRDNKLENIQDLLLLRALESLELSQNNISHLLLTENSWPRLKSLNVSNNSLKDFDFIASLLELQALDASQNQISCVTAQRHEKLQVLKLNFNVVRHVTDLSQLPALKLLSLDNNRLRSFDVAATELRELSLNSNRIQNFDFIQPSALPQLHALSIVGNPIARLPASKNQLIIRLPQLLYLNKEIITASDRARAAFWLAVVESS